MNRHFSQRSQTCFVILEKLDVMLLQLLTEHDLDNAGHVFAVGAVAVVEEVSHAERVAIFVDFDNGKFDT